MTDTVCIDYWDLVSRSVKLAWKHKFLWFFGFFASASGGNLGQWTEEGGEWIRDFILQHISRPVFKCGFRSVAQVNSC